MALHLYSTFGTCHGPPMGKKCMMLAVEPTPPAPPQPSQVEFMSILMKISDEQAAMHEDHTHEMASMRS